MNKSPVKKPNTLYTYVSAINRNYAFSIGKKNFRSVSRYIDHLISQDRSGKSKTRRVTDKQEKTNA